MTRRLSQLAVKHDFIIRCPHTHTHHEGAWRSGGLAPFIFNHNFGIEMSGYAPAVSLLGRVLAVPFEYENKQTSEQVRVFLED